MRQSSLISLLFIGWCLVCFVQCKQRGDLTKKLETPHFVFLFDEAPGALDGMGQFLESKIQRVLTAFNVKPDQKILMEVYPSIERFHQRQFGRRMEDWVVGNCDAESRIIRLVSPNHPGKEHNYHSILKVALHEAIHRLTDLLQKDHTILPTWLSEGVASYYAEQLNEKKKFLRKLIKANKQPLIEELNGEGFVEHNGYAFSGALVEYLVRVYGEKKLRRLLKNPRDLEKELSITMTNLNQNWQADLVNSYL